ncbi:hypothetical protein IV203_030552 [Nitzschia inconspicua]|uniref:Uncharacterized protein n=1 Tax=Nitzschia inconspicua TaxID=303405 RepID=A0A9K3LTQ6_9STRA|nr:hypothetical protein IV203_022888 [Nitzschia inconspicua]KAG7367809.1 hypothetical protein IV203_030552 [Nitzschia inconspicua]
MSNHSPRRDTFEFIQRHFFVCIQKETFMRPAIQESCMWNNKQDALGWNQTGIDLFYAQRFDDATIAFSLAISMTKQDALEKEIEKAFTGDEVMGSGILDPPIIIQMQTSLEPLVIQVQNWNPSQQKSEQHLVLITSVIVLNLAITKHSSTIALLEGNSSSPHDSDPHIQRLWDCVCRLYECASALLDEYLQRAESGATSRDQTDDIAAMIHRSLKLQLIHNMARIYERLEQSNIVARRLYGRIFSYIVSMNLVCKDNRPENAPEIATLLLPGFPLDQIMDSFVQGLGILSPAVTASAA